jgi:hypothetical protein
MSEKEYDEYTEEQRKMLIEERTPFLEKVKNILQNMEYPLSPNEASFSFTYGFSFYVKIESTYQNPWYDTSVVDIIKRKDLELEWYDELIKQGKNKEYIGIVPETSRTDQLAREMTPKLFVRVSDHYKKEKKKLDKQMSYSQFQMLTDDDLEKRVIQKNQIYPFEQEPEVYIDINSKSEEEIAVLLDILIERFLKQSNMEKEML